MKCPKCGSHKVRSYDNESLHHPPKEELKTKEDYDRIGVDYEIYVHTICDDCGYTTNNQLPIAKDYTNADNLALNTILESLDPDSLLEKSLRKVIEMLGRVEKNHDICDMQTENKELTYNVDDMLHRLSIIEASPELNDKFREKFGTAFPMIRACIKDNLIKGEAIALINKLTLKVYKLNGRLFLEGETRGEYDFIGDNLDTMTATELFDMTEEMKSGISYSMYVSDVSFFELASVEEHLEVAKFLEFIKNN